MLILQSLFTLLALCSAVFVFIYRKKELKNVNDRLAKYNAVSGFLTQPLPPGTYTTRNHSLVVETVPGAILRFNWKLKRWFLEDGRGGVFVTDEVLGFFPIEKPEDPYTLVDGVD